MTKAVVPAISKRLVWIVKIIIGVVKAVAVLKIVEPSFATVIITLKLSFLFSFIPVVSFVGILNGCVHIREQFALRFYITVLAYFVVWILIRRNDIILCICKKYCANKK